MSKLLANEIANYGDNAPIDLKEGLNIPAGKPIQAAGVAGSSGMVLTSTGTSISWTIPFDGNYNSLTNKPTIPAAQVNSDWNASSGVAVILNKPSVPALPSVTTASASGGGSLAYNAGNGEFTFTPPDLSGYATETWVGSQGYLTSYAESDTLDSVTGRGSTTTNNISVGDLSTSGLSSVANSLTLGNGSSTFTILFSQSTGSSPRIVNSISSSGLAIQGAYNFGSTYAEDIFLGTSGISSRFKNLNPQADLSYNLGSSTAKWDNIYAGKLYYSNNFATTGDLPSATDYHGMFAHVHAEGHGYMAHGGVWVQLLDEGSSIDELADVNTTTNADGYVLKWEASSSSWKPAPDLVGTNNAGITLADLTVQTASAGTPSLSYSNTTGVFTYTPPDLSGYLTTETDPVYSASPAAGILSSNISNWDTAYGWGNHASAGYLTAESDTLQSVITRGGTVTSGTPSFETNTFFTGTGTGAGNGGKPYLFWDPTNNQLAGSDDIEIVLGYNGDLKIETDGTNVLYSNFANVLHTIENPGEREAWNSKVSGVYVPSLKINHNAAVELYHANGQIRLETSSTGVTVTGALTAGGLTYPTTNGNPGEVLTSDGAGNVSWSAVSGGGGGGGANVTISDTIPAGTPTAGDLWWESDKGRLKVYYTDTNSSQWVDVNPPLKPSLSSDAPVTASSAGTVGDIRYDSSYVYICIATDTWKRAAIATW
tara:strand:- start:41 stop:2173 length:2133 start_codon:yes stop_codon:yes gene_type:complete